MYTYYYVKGTTIISVYKVYINIKSAHQKLRSRFSRKVSNGS